MTRTEKKMSLKSEVASPGIAGSISTRNLRISQKSACSSLGGGGGQIEFGHFDPFESDHDITVTQARSCISVSGATMDRGPLIRKANMDHRELLSNRDVVRGACSLHRENNR
jgi:hypothetical protein